MKTIYIMFKIETQIDLNLFPITVKFDNRNESIIDVFKETNNYVIIDVSYTYDSDVMNRLKIQDIMNYLSNVLEINKENIKLKSIELEGLSLTILE